MGLTQFRLYSCISLLFLAQYGWASDSKLYIGAAAGTSSYSGIDDLFYELGGGGEQNYDTSDSDIAYQIQLGWEISRYVAIEVAYSDYGDADSEYRYQNADVNGHQASSTAEYQANLTAANISIKGMLPLGDTFRLYGKVGYAKWLAEVSWNETLYFDDRVDSRSTGSDDVDGNDVSYALGLDFRLTDSLILFGEYFTQLAEYEDVAGETHDWFEASAVTLGVRWQFDAGVFNRNGPQSQYGNRKLTACDDKYKDISGAICKR
ncbi:MAG: outer membrane beta-barrel protein [Pseudomonadota bacterium]|nr:outer membrane beta-barrel protein [Pseudomonadota bacterium]